MSSNSSFVLEGEDSFLLSWLTLTAERAKNERGEDGRAETDFGEGDGGGGVVG